MRSSARTPGARGAAAVAAVLAVAACSKEPATVPPPVPAASALAPGQDTDVFRNVVGGSGIDFVHVVADGVMDTLPESVGAGVTCLDYDGDGRLDLYFVATAWREGVSDGERAAGRTKNRLYRNLGGWKFEDVTDRAGVGFEDFCAMAVAADLDDDGRTDLYLLNDGPNRLMRNRGDGTFEDVTAKAGVAGDRCSVAGAAFDADGDGLLDLYVGNYVTFDRSYRLAYKPDVFPGPLAFTAQADVLYLNNGDGTFRDATAGSGIDVPPGRAMGVSILDYDVDGRADVFVANDATQRFLFRNEGGGKFREVATALGAGYGIHGEATAAMAGFAGDIDGDGRPDLYVSDASYGSLLLGGPKGFTDHVLRSGIAGPAGQWPSWGGGFLDYDLDGNLDLFLACGDLHRATGRPSLLFRGKGDGKFEDAAPGAGAWFREERCGRGACIADLDGDGRLDIVVTHIGDRPALLRAGARSGPANHWAMLALRAKPRNASGQGAKVTLRAGGKDRIQTAWPRCGYLGEGDPRLHFGLGAADRIERLEIVWPDGSKQEFKDVAADRTLTVEQGGSIQ